MTLPPLGRRETWEFLLVIAVLGAVTAAGFVFPPLSSLSVGLLYLLAIILMSLRVGRWPMLLGGLLSALLWEYMFVEPRFQFRLRSVQDVLMVAIYVVVALVAGQLADRIRKQARDQKLREESDRLHRTLLDSVSHELRTPLAVMNAALENLEGSPPPGKEGVLAEMHTAVRRLNRLVGNLLDQTRLESGALRPRMDWCDAADILHAAIADVKDALGPRELILAIPDDLPPVWADFGLTEHALANLILNAALHTSPPAAIALSTGILREAGQGYFAVADGGQGVPSRVKTQLFQKFTRGDGAGPGGLGLGLSIARGFIRAQGGEIGLADNPGGGSVFTIYLPLRVPQPDPLE